MVSIPDGSFKRFEYYAVKLLAKQTKWTLLEFRTYPTFLEILISKSDFGPVKLPGLSRNGPLGEERYRECLKVADPALELRGGGGGIYLPCWLFSLLPFLFFLP